MTKLKGIFLDFTDDLLVKILSINEKSVSDQKNPVFSEKPQFNPFPKLFTIFSPLNTQKLLLSSIGKRISKLFLQEMCWGTRVSKGEISSILKNLKEKELLPHNKGTLVFWRLIQDLLFEICEDHSLSNTEQIELGNELCKIVMKVYFVSGEAKEDLVYLEKYVMFLADSLVRGLDHYSDLLSFCFVGALVYKGVLEKEHVRKLGEFLKVEKRKKEEELGKIGKELGKMENYAYFEKFEGVLEKLGKEQVNSKKKEKKNQKKKEKSDKKDVKNEEEKDEKNEEEEEKEGKNDDYEEKEGSKRKDIVEDEEMEDENTKKVVDYNKSSERPKRKTQRKKYI